MKIYLRCTSLSRIRLTVCLPFLNRCSAGNLLRTSSPPFQISMINITMFTHIINMNVIKHILTNPVQSAGESTVPRL